MAALAALPLSACGGEGEDGIGKRGGSMSIVHAAFPDYLDPALSFTVDGWQPLLQAYPGLLVFPHKGGPEGAEPVPGLAEDLPEVSSDGRIYRLRLRGNLQFSDGTPIRASDFKASIERVLEQDSQGSSFYAHIVGGEEFLKTKKGGVSGIEVDDSTGDITIRLTKPRGSFVYELAIPFAGIVPRTTPATNKTQDPPPGAGRYVIREVSVGRSYELVKNPNFPPALEGTAVDAGKIDTFEVRVAPVANSTTQIAQNKADFQVENPAPDRIQEIRSKYPDRYRQFTTPSTYYFFMNSETKPFDELKVRQAVNHAIDPDALNRIHGGVVAATNETLPEQVPGYKDTADLYPHDLDRAKQLIEEAGATGASVSVWGINDNPAKAVVEYYLEVLKDIGLRAKLKLIAPQTYFTTIGDRSVKAQTGWANWTQDYPHPADFIDVLLNPDNVMATGNNNYSYNVKDRELARKINAAVAEPVLTDEVKDRWAEIDREIQEKAYWAVYGTQQQSTFFSERMDFENCDGGDWPAGTHDWARFCLKK